MMRNLVIGLSAALLVGAAPPPGPSDILSVTPGQLFEGNVAGTAMRYQISADAGDRLALNPGLAKQAGLKQGFLGAFAKMLGAGSKIGSIKVPASIGNVIQTLDGQPFKQYVLWYNRDVVSNGDGEIGIYGLAHQIISFRLRPPLANETTYALSMSQRSSGTVGIIHGEGENQIFLRFDFSRDRSLATAAAGARLAQLHGGAFAGDVLRPIVKFGVARPARALKMTSPFRVGPFVIDQPLVRLVDYGDTTKIRDTQQSDEDIIVKGKRRGDEDNSFIYIGQNDVAHCSSVTFDKVKREIRLSCIDKL